MTDEELERALSRSLAADAPQDPPAERVAALRAQVATRQGAAHDPARRTTSRTWLAAAAAVVVGLAVGAASAWALTRHDSDDRVAGAVEYAGPMDGPDGRTAAAELAVIATGIGRVVELDTDALPVLPTGEFYEVWFVALNDTADAPVRISAGTFHPDPDGRSHVQMTAAVDPRKYPVVEVTAEPSGGNPTTHGPVVLRVTIPA